MRQPSSCGRSCRERRLELGLAVPSRPPHRSRRRASGPRSSVVEVERRARRRRRRRRVMAILTPAMPVPARSSRSCRRSYSSTVQLIVFAMPITETTSATGVALLELGGHVALPLLVDGQPLARSGSGRTTTAQTLLGGGGEGRGLRRCCPMCVPLSVIASRWVGDAISGRRAGRRSRRRRRRGRCCAAGRRSRPST